jgi:hypothetical protein
MLNYNYNISYYYIFHFYKKLRFAPKAGDSPDMLVCDPSSEMIKEAENAFKLVLVVEGDAPPSNVSSLSADVNEAIKKTSSSLGVMQSAVKSLIADTRRRSSTMSNVPIFIPPLSVEDTKALSDGLTAGKDVLLNSPSGRKTLPAISTTSSMAL